MDEVTMEMRRLNEQIGQLFPAGGVDLERLFQMLLQGEVTEACRLLFSQLTGGLRGEIQGYFRLAALLLCIGLISALLTNLTDMFENKQVSDIGFYFVYLLLMLTLLHIFGRIASIADSALADLLLFMKLFLPLYFLTVCAAGGAATGLLYYQMTLLLIYGVETALSVILMPLIKVYLFLNFMNGMWVEEKLQTLLEFIRRIVGYLLKLSLAVVTGVSFLQAMIVPVTDSVKLTSIQKAISCIPGIGTISDGAAQMLVGSAVLIKNSVGALAMLLLCFLAAAPLIRIWLLAMVMKLCAALIGLLSDKRLVNCIDRTGEGSLMILRCLLTAGGLFMVSIAIVSMTTNHGF